MEAITRKRGSSKKHLFSGAFLIVALLAVVGVLLFVQQQGANSYLSPTNTPSSKKSAEGRGHTENTLSNKATTSSLSYKATVRRKHGSGAPQTIRVEADSSNGARRFIEKVDGRLSAHVYSGEVTYICNEQTCQKMPWRDDSPYADNSEQYAYDVTPELIKRYNQHATSKKLADCESGKCAVWEVPPDDTSLTPTSETVSIDEASQRIVKRVKKYVQTGYTETIIYQYVPVTITLPPTPQSLPTL